MAEVGYNVYAQERRYIETRVAEITLVEHIATMYKSIQDNVTTGWHSVNNTQNQILDILANDYNSWQSFPEHQNKAGLDRGAHGEYFMRLIGAGILEDLPHRFLSEDGKDISGVEILATPSGDDGVGIFDVTFKIESGKKNEFGRVRVNASMQSLRARMKDLSEEMRIYNERINEGRGDWQK